MNHTILAYIEASRTILSNTRVVLKHVEKEDPTNAFDLLNIGAERAEFLFTLSKNAYQTGEIDRPTLMAAVRLATDWLVFDDDVLDLVAAAIPVRGQYPPGAVAH